MTAQNKMLCVTGAMGGLPTAFVCSARRSKHMALTGNAEIVPAVGTFFERSLGDIPTPGALIEAFNFALCVVV